MNRSLCAAAPLVVFVFALSGCGGDGDLPPDGAGPSGAAPAGGTLPDVPPSARPGAPNPASPGDTAAAGAQAGAGEPPAPGAVEPTAPTPGLAGAAPPPGGAQPETGGPTATGTSQDATAILTRASARLAELDAFCGDFRQEIRIPLLGQTTRSAGRLCQRRPNLFAMDFTDPQGDRVVADGTWVWTYFPSSDPRQVVRFPLAEQGRMDFFQEFVAEPGVRYVPSLEGEEDIGGRAAWRIVLEPRDRTYFNGARVWIDRQTALLRKVEIEQENGSVRTVELGDLDLNPSIPASRFLFTPPEGTQVFTPPPPGGGA